MKFSGISAIVVMLPPVPVITAPAGSEVAVDAVLVPVDIQVELTVALTPWACHAEERVSVNGGAVRTIICPASLEVAPEVAEVEEVRVPESSVAEVMDPVREGKVDAEAAADAN